MVSAKNAMLILTMLAPLAICFGAVYRVGDDSGWHPRFDYQKWASSHKFFVGDTIRFQYNAIFHNVKEVTEWNYHACNATFPIATHYSGNESFTLKKPGHRYFICGFPNHCIHGQKVDIYVRQVQAPAPAPAPGPSPTPTPTSPSPPHTRLSPPPSPPPNSVRSNNHASSLKHVQNIATITLAMLVLLSLHLV